MQPSSLPAPPEGREVLTKRREEGSRVPLEVWAGVESTHHRLGDRFYDQLEWNGHATRLTDLDRFAELGIRAMRYPVLWERTAPDGLASADWSWPDERLQRLRTLGIQPIVGLVHHGSGPRHTSLVDPAFPEGVASFARAVAERYPWVESYTPINEPLTTARFSGLYGHWYPHGRDDHTFLLALVTQCRAVVLAMQAIRQVNPRARLVQTEDLGRTSSTPTLAYQAAFENERRWLSFDLLCGRVRRDHPMWGYLLKEGIDERQLDWFSHNPCPPDIIGINHYLSSERFLDERLKRYPASSHGGNGRHAYADVLTSRVCAEGAWGPRSLMSEVWERYQLPMAVTEAHNGSTREEQLRWLLDVWNAAHALLRGGADMRAVTIWSLLGAFDWDRLLTQIEGHYEPGAFDIRAPTPRPTALAGMVRDLAAGRAPDHPVLSTPGWWRRPDRFHYPVIRCRPETNGADGLWPGPRPAPARPVLITGARGTLGTALARLCQSRGLEYRTVTRSEMDIAEPASVAAALEVFRPWAVVNAAGYVRVDQAEQDPEACYRENCDGPAVLAAACAERGVSLLTFSSDLVFDGRCRRPYVESDALAPLSVYGRTKAEAERRVLEAMPSALVIRTSVFFGPWDEHNFVTQALRALSSGRRFVAADDTVVSPTYVPDLVHACLDLLVDGESGVWHLANVGATTWASLARQAAEMVGLDDTLVEGSPMKRLGLPAARPPYTVLGSERGVLLPSLDDALCRYIGECTPSWLEEQSKGVAVGASPSLET